MIEITTRSMEWSSEDMVLWRQFLESRAGTRLIPKILEAIPSLLPEGDVNKILIRTGEVRGFQQAIQAMLHIAVPPQPEQEPTKSEYPALDDDAAWGDGHKLTDVVNP